MPEIKAFSNDRSKLNGQFGNCVKEKCTSRLDNSATFLYPLTAPLKILGVSETVIVSVLVVFTNVERRISEHCIDNTRLEGSKYLQAVGIKKSTVRKYGFNMFALYILFLGMSNW